MPISTCIDMIQAALRTSGVLGVGQTAIAEDFNTGFDLLLEISDMWREQRFMCWQLSEEVIPATGAQFYVLQDRPPNLDSAYARLMTTKNTPSIYNAGPLDFPLYIIDTQDEYNEISLKRLTTFPAAVWYQRDYPENGAVWFWPIPPEEQFELHVFYRQALPKYTALTDPLNIPTIYQRALRYELAALMRIEYAREPRLDLLAALAGTKATIRAANASMGQLKMPAPLVPGLGGSGGISGAVGPHQSVIVLDSDNSVLG